MSSPPSALPPSELEKNLVAISRAAASVLEEQGFGALFLALGFLEWVDRGQAEPQRSPVLLVPVELKRRTVRSRFHLQASGGDVLVNPALAHKLRQDWEIELTLPEGGELDEAPE